MRPLYRRIFQSLFAIFAVVAFGLTAFALPAGASTRPISITNDVNIRPGPDTTQAPLAKMPAGSAPHYICYADGQNIGGTTKWFNVSWNGVTGYYSSIADDVPLASQSNLEALYGITRCGTGADINQGSYAGATVLPAPVAYNRASAVSWASQNVQNSRLMDRFPDCTWFVSQALWYGGLPQSNDWNMQDHHGFPLWPIQGTATATAAIDLTAYLESHFSVKVVPLGPDRFRGNAVPEAQPGDVIAYDWDTVAGNDHHNGSGIDHLAFVTDIAPGSYPEVSEWGTHWPQEPYAKRGWTWSGETNQWLQQEFPNQGPNNIGVTAVLIHFNY